MATAASFGPLLRLFTVANTHNNSQQTDVTALPAPTPGWHRSSNQSVAGPADFSYFSGACYFAGVSLRQRLPKVPSAASNGTVDVPIGLIASSWSGSAIEPWMPPSAFATCNRTVETELVPLSAAGGAGVGERLLLRRRGGAQDAAHAARQRQR